MVACTHGAAPVSGPGRRQWLLPPVLLGPAGEVHPLQGLLREVNGAAAAAGVQGGGGATSAGGAGVAGGCSGAFGV